MDFSEKCLRILLKLSLVPMSLMILKMINFIKNLLKIKKYKKKKMVYRKPAYLTIFSNIRLITTIHLSFCKDT